MASTQKLCATSEDFRAQVNSAFAKTQKDLKSDDVTKVIGLKTMAAHLATPAMRSVITQLSNKNMFGAGLVLPSNAYTIEGECSDGQLNIAVTEATRKTYRLTTPYTTMAELAAPPKGLTPPNAAANAPDTVLSAKKTKKLRLCLNPTKWKPLEAGDLQLLRQRLDEREVLAPLPEEGGDEAQKTFRNAEAEIELRRLIDKDIARISTAIFAQSSCGHIYTIEDRDLMSDEILKKAGQRLYKAQVAAVRNLVHILLEMIENNRFGSQHVRKTAPNSIADPATELIGAMDTKCEVMEEDGFDVLGEDNEKGLKAVFVFVSWLHEVLRGHDKLYRRVFDEHNSTSLFQLLAGTEDATSTPHDTVYKVIMVASNLLQRHVSAGLPQRVLEDEARVVLKGYGVADHATCKLRDDIDARTKTAAEVLAQKNDFKGAISLFKAGGIDHVHAVSGPFDPDMFTKDYVIEHMALPQFLRGDKRAAATLKKGKAGGFPFLSTQTAGPLGGAVDLVDWCDLAGDDAKAWLRAYISWKREVNPYVPKMVRTERAAAAAADDDNIDDPQYWIDREPTGEMEIESEPSEASSEEDNTGTRSSRPRGKRGGKRERDKNDARKRKKKASKRDLAAAVDTNEEAKEKKRAKKAAAKEADAQAAAKKKAENRARDKANKAKSAKRKREKGQKMQRQINALAVQVAQGTASPAVAATSTPAWLSEFPADIQAMCPGSTAASAPDNANAVAALKALGFEKVAAIETTSICSDDVLSVHDLAAPMWKRRAINLGLVVLGLIAVTTLWVTVGSATALCTGGGIAIAVGSAKLPSWGSVAGIFAFAALIMLGALLAANLFGFPRVDKVAPALRPVASAAAVNDVVLPPGASVAVPVALMTYNLTIEAASTYEFSCAAGIADGWTFDTVNVLGGALINGTYDVTVNNLGTEPCIIAAGAHVADVTVPRAAPSAASIEHTFGTDFTVAAIADFFVAGANVIANRVYDIRYMMVLDGPTNEPRAYFFFYDGMGNKLGQCLADSGSTSDMFIRKECVEVMNKAGRTAWFWPYNTTKQNEHKVTTYGKGKSPRIVGMWGGLVTFNIKAPGSDVDNFVEILVTAFIIDGTSPGADLLAGCRWLGAHGVIPKPELNNGNLTNEVLLQYNTIIGDSLPTIMLNEIAKPGSEQVVVVPEMRSVLVSAAQRQSARQASPATGVTPAASAAAAMDLEDADVTDPLLNHDLVETVQHLHDAYNGHIASIVKSLAAASDVSIDTARQRVSWAFKNGVEIDRRL